MADDGHTINVGPVTVGKIATGGRTGPQDPAPSGGSIDANAIRNEDGTWDDVLALCDEVDRLRAENAVLAAALGDIAGMLPVATTPSGIGVWIADAECSRMDDATCHDVWRSHPDEWCPVCVAEVAWCAWKMGVLR